MSWLKISFAVDRGQLDYFSGVIEHAGAQAITIEDAGENPLFDQCDGESPVWDANVVTGLFDVEKDIDTILAALADSFAPDKLPDYRVESLPDQDWERCWMDRFQPLQYGNNLWICPSWCDAPDPAATNIMLDPGLAFGSGSHETTRLCMQWLGAQQIKGKKIIDFGCGSGILAIATLMLGAECALGIDIDPQALLASRNNAEINDVSERLQLSLPAALPASRTADIVFANILAGTLIDLKADLLKMRASHGVLVLSGILNTQEAMVVDAYQVGNDLRIDREGDWLMITVKEMASNTNITGTM